MRLHEWFKKFIHFPGVSVLGGLLLGAAVAGIIALIMIYWLQPALTPGTRGLVRYRSERFVIWYPREIPASADFDPATLAAILNRDLHDLMTLLQVDPKVIPNPIDVFVHPSIGEMQRSIALRKSGTARVTYTAPLDLLVGEDPRPRLAELVLAFGWGQCNSLLLKTGMRLYAAQPHRDFYAVIAALPDRLFLTVPQLINLEAEGYLTLSSVYEQFDSPYSAAMISSMAAFRNLLDLTPGGEQKSIPALEAAALVQYLISHYGGIGAIRSIWGPGSTDRLLTQLTGESLTALSADWRTVADKQGPTAPDYERWHIYYLLASGAPDSAYSAAMAWYKAGKATSDYDLLLVARCALVVDDVATASTISRRAGGEVRSQLGEYITLYTGWKTATSAGIRVIAPNETMAQSGLNRVEEIYGTIATKLALTKAQLPQRLTVFLYSDSASLTVGERLIPFPADQCAVLHLLNSDDVATDIAEVLPAYAWNTLTYSATLRIGVAGALTQPEQALVAAGCQLRRDGRWVRLGAADADAVDAEVVKVEIGLMVDYLMRKFGPGSLQRLWVVTSPRDQYLPLDFAIKEVYGLTRDQIGTAIINSFLKCG